MSLGWGCVVGVDVAATRPPLRLDLMQQLLLLLLCVRMDDEHWCVKSVFALPAAVH